jgi:hypothetical protein
MNMIQRGWYLLLFSAFALCGGVEADADSWHWLRVTRTGACFKESTARRIVLPVNTLLMATSRSFRVRLGAIARRRGSRSLDSIHAHSQPGAFIFNNWVEAWGKHVWFLPKDADPNIARFSTMDGKPVEGILRNCQL